MKLIKARKGVFGRQATAEERARLQRFANRYVTSTTASSTDNSERLQAFAASMLRGKANGKLVIVGTGSVRANRPVRVVRPLAVEETHPRVVGAPAKGVVSKRAIAKGAGTAVRDIIAKGTTAKSAAGKRIPAKNAVSKGAPTKSAVSKGMLAKSVAAKGISAKTAAARGTPAQSAVAKGISVKSAATKGTPAKSAAAKSATTKGMPAKSAVAKGISAKSATTKRPFSIKNPASTKRSTTTVNQVAKSSVKRHAKA